MPEPTTYYEWTNNLERFANGDDVALQEMQHGVFTVDSGTVYRFYDKVKEAYVARKNRWVDQFSRSHQVSRIKSESDLSIILQSAKGNLRPIAAFIRLSAFPDDLQETLRKDFEKFVTETRKNIKAEVQKAQPGNEKVLLVVNTFNFFDSPQHVGSAMREEQNVPAQGRRILF